MVDWGFLFERFRSFCYSRLKTARSSISGSKILKGNVNRVSGLHFFFKRFNLPKVVYIPCFFFTLLAGLVLVSGGLSKQEKNLMHKVLESESLVDHCSPEDLKVLQKFCSTIKSPKDFKGSVCEFFLESKSAEIAEKVRLNIIEITKSRGFWWS
jgi:hypothetical protein